MIAGIGIDIVSLSRVERLHARFGERFEKRLYTPQESDQAKGRTAYLAGRFAVKEALLKALGTGLTDGIRWGDIETVTQPSGAPETRCYGRVTSLLDSRKVSKIWTSISHEKDQVVALVILEGRGS
jgi:holo-[acyl-carrier protein] synthase